jgi:thioredoxin reductase (NADPH)
MDIEPSSTPVRDEHAGVFAAGDVRYGSVKRVAAAVGEGSVAVGSVHRYLEEQAWTEDARTDHADVTGNR